MVHQIDAEHDQDGGHGAVAMLRPAAAASAPVRRTTQPAPTRPAQREPSTSRKPIWDKDNFGFWLSVCILISLAFSIAWRAIG